DVVTTPDKRMVDTRLERFLQDFNVDVGNDRIMGLIQNNPDMALLVPNPRVSDRNSLAAGLADMQPLPMFDARTVRPRAGAGPREQAAAGGDRQRRLGVECAAARHPGRPRQLAVLFPVRQLTRLAPRKTQQYRH